MALLLWQVLKYNESMCFHNSLRWGSYGTFCYGISQNFNKKKARCFDVLLLLLVLLVMVLMLLMLLMLLLLLVVQDALVLYCRMMLQLGGVADLGGVALVELHQMVVVGEVAAEGWTW